VVESGAYLDACAPTVTTSGMLSRGVRTTRAIAIGVA
jgi:hypothetical protein